MSQLIHKPKIIIPLAIVIAVLIAVMTYNHIGQTPTANLSLDQASTTSASFVDTSTNSVDLAFPKVGRIAEVKVRVGDLVQKGEVLASLEAADALGAVSQAKGALELAKAQYASLDVQYANAKNQQDTLVSNAYRTLLSSDLIATAAKPDYDKSSASVDNNQAPIISGTYICDNQGTYEISPYASGAPTGYSFTFKGLEEGSGNVAWYSAQPFGACGLFIKFPTNYSAGDIKWIVTIPNSRSASYAQNKNAYDLAVATRDQVLKQYEANLGQNGSSAAATAQATIDAAEGAYQTALGVYQNDLIVSPFAGAVTFIDSHLKVGQSVVANKAVISITKK